MTRKNQQDPLGSEEKEERRKERIREAVQEHLAKASAQERRLWEGYRALTALPGGDKWPLHRNTAFLKAYLKVSKTAFYPAHLRFKGGMEDLAKSLGLLCGETKAFGIRAVS